MDLRLVDSRTYRHQKQSRKTQKALSTLFFDSGFLLLLLFLLFQIVGQGEDHALMIRIQRSKYIHKAALAVSQIGGRMVKKLRNRNIAGCADFLDGLHTRFRILFKHRGKRGQRNTGMFRKKISFRSEKEIREKTTAEKLKKKVQ